MIGEVEGIEQRGLGQTRRVGLHRVVQKTLEGRAQGVVEPVERRGADDRRCLAHHAGWPGLERLQQIRASLGRIWGFGRRRDRFDLSLEIRPTPLLLGHLGVPALRIGLDKRRESSLDGVELSLESCRQSDESRSIEDHRMVEILEMPLRELIPSTRPLSV